MICNKCGGTVPDTDKFCTFCGNDLAKQREEEAAQKAAAAAQDKAAQEPLAAPTEDMTFRCPNCGAEIQPGDKFCVTCGAPVVAGPQGETPVPADAGTQEAAIEQNNAPVVNPEQNITPQADNQQGYPNGYDPNFAQNAQYQNQGFDPNQQYNPQYAQNQQGTFYAQQNPNYQQQQPTKEKKKSKTPVWVWLVIALLVVGIVFCIIWFFVLPKSNNNNQAGNQNNAVVSSTETGDASGDGVAVNNAPARQYINENSEYATDAEDQLGMLAADTIHKAKGWRNKNLMGECEVVNSYWDGNDLIVIVEATINEDAANDVVEFYHDYYYTYMKYKNVYRQDGSYHCEGSPVTPHGKLLNLYESSGSHHMAAGYETQGDAENAANNA